ncbi:MAG: heme exporter protein CcmB [Woeseiaceae bacterium]
MTLGVSSKPVNASRPAEMRPLSVFSAMLGRELRLAFRRPADLLNPVFFFAMVVALFPIAVSPLPAVLKVLGPGVVWVAVLLAGLLPLNSIFAQDYEDGTLEQYLLSGQSLVAICFAKTLSLWLVSILPLVLVSAFVAQSYLLPLDVVPILVISLSLGGYSICALGAVAAALTIGVQRSNALIALLVLPLMVPVLIFGARAVSLASTNSELGGSLGLLGAVALLSLLLAPVAAAAALRISLE